MSNVPSQYPHYGAPPKGSSKLPLYLGLGCLGLVVLGVVVFVAALGVGWYMLSHSEAATTATSFVAQSPEAKAELGEPLDCSFSSGTINTNNGEGTATITVSASGPKGSGTATVQLRSTNSGPWQVASSELTGGPSGTTVRLK